ncbi:aminoacetone oxidase family FAD-binding enzyme, partial [Ellagibacter isourolithinifaciens]|uniref:aminoacetone oxidase family FAD-binding enzyme n=1 Tax=Ellagibacter isourolithinifaciens TaxID=2137581 RepID=UPI003AABCEE5
MKKIAIIGGGAAGLAAAIAAGNELVRLGAADECEIVLFEADPERVGRSILATGNGRCNFSNAHIDPACYRNADFVEATLRSLARLSGVSEWGSAQPVGAYGASAQGSAQPADAFEAPGRESSQPVSAFEAPVQRFFSSLGLMWREEGEGRMYPAANKASSVLDVLRAALDVSGARVEFGKALRAIEAPARGKGRFHLRFSDGSIAHAEKVVLAVGGRGVSAVDTSSVIPCELTRPVLGPLATDSRITRQLNNIRVKCAVSLERSGSLVAREEGELLFRDYGVSGVCVFNLSRFACEGDMLSIDFLPHMPAADRDAWLFARRKHLSARLGENGQIAAEDVLRGAMLPQVAQVLCKC